MGELLVAWKSNHDKCVETTGQAKQLIEEKRSTIMLPRGKRWRIRYCHGCGGLFVTSDRVGHGRSKSKP